MYLIEFLTRFRHLVLKLLLKVLDLLLRLLELEGVVFLQLVSEADLCDLLGVGRLQLLDVKLGLLEVVLQLLVLFFLPLELLLAQFELVVQALVVLAQREVLVLQLLQVVLEEARLLRQLLFFGDQSVFFGDGVLDLLLRHDQGLLGCIKALVVGILRFLELPGQLIELLLEQVVPVECVFLVSEVGFRVLPERSLGLLKRHLLLLGKLKLLLELLDFRQIPLTQLFQLF